MIRLVLAEDQTLLLGALASLLDLEEDIEVAGRATSGDEARTLIESQRPDLVLTDIEMPGSTGLDLAEWVRDNAPETTVMILTTFARPGYLRRALEAGVRGYLLKETPAEKLGEAIRRIQGGQRVIDPELALTAFDSRDPLTERERQILKLAGDGLGNAAIGRRLHLAEGVDASATTSPKPSANSMPTTASMPGASPAIKAGCSAKPTLERRVERLFVGFLPARQEAMLEMVQRDIGAGLEKNEEHCGTGPAQQHAEDQGQVHRQDAQIGQHHQASGLEGSAGEIGLDVLLERGPMAQPERDRQLDR